MQRMATTSKDQFGRTPESYDTKMVIKEKLAIAGGETQRTYMAVVNSKKHSASATTLTYTPFKPVPSQYVACSSLLQVPTTRKPHPTALTRYCCAATPSGTIGSTRTLKRTVEAGVLQLQRCARRSTTSKDDAMRLSTKAHRRLVVCDFGLPTRRRALSGWCFIVDEGERTSGIRCAELPRGVQRRCS